jgi:diaminopimelate epimerase
MGNVNFEADWILPQEKVWLLAKNYNLNPREIICADIGNPHLIIFSQGLTDDDKKLLGAKLSLAELFPGGINVNFAQIQNNNILLQVWERGVGFTLACGSGTCASFAAACRLGYIDENKECNVIFKLGSLSLKFSDKKEVLLSGPAEKLAQGEYYYV